MPAFMHALWITDPSKRAKGLNMQPSPQNKGGARVTSMLYVTDNKPGLIPYSLRKGLQLKRVQVFLYWYTGPPLYVTIQITVCHSPTVMSASLGHNEWGRENQSYLADNLAHKAIKQSLPLELL